MTVGSPAHVGEFRRGWTVLLSAMIGNGLGFVAIPFYTIGAVAPFLHDQFGWSFTEIMAGVPIVSIVVLALSPVVGRLTDWIGVRRVALVSLAAYGAAFMLFAANPGSIPFYYANWVLLGIAGSGTLPLVWTRAVNNWFDRHKGMALGITMMGTGIFGSLAKLTVAVIEPRFGWQACYLAIGLAPLLIALPIAFLAFRDRQVPPAEAAEKGIARVDEPGMEFRDILHSWRFWLIGISFLMLALALGGPMPHLENILYDKGFNRGDAAAMVIVFGLSVVVGRLLGGYLLDRFWAPGVALAIFLLPAIGMGVFLYGSPSVALAIAMVALVGLGSGVEYDLMSFLIARYFGMRRYGSAYGTLYLMFGIGSGAGPMLFAWAYDVQQSYTMILQIATLLLIVPSLLLLTLGSYAFPVHHEKDVKQ